MTVFFCVQNDLAGFGSGVLRISNSGIRGLVSGTPKTFRPSHLGHTPYLISDSSTRFYQIVDVLLSFCNRIGSNPILSLALACLVWVGMGCYLVSCPVCLSWLVSLAGIGFAGVWYLVSRISFLCRSCDCVCITDYSINNPVKKTPQDLKSIRPRL